MAHQPSPVGGVLLVGKCRQRETGNATTLARFREYVQAGGWRCVAHDPDDLPDLPDLQQFLGAHGVIAAVGLHAYRCSRVLLACREVGVPYLVMFGGTDVNECVREEAKMEVMTRVVEGAAHLVASCQALRRSALVSWPFLEAASVSILPQAVQVDPSSDFDVARYLQGLDQAYISFHLDETYCRPDTSDNINRNANDINDSSEQYNRISSKPPEGENENKHLSCTENDRDNYFEGKLSQNTANPDPKERSRMAQDSTEELTVRNDLPAAFQPLVLLVAGLRPVKDVLFVAEAWSAWRQARGGHGTLLIMGPPLDQEYALQVKRKAARLAGVRVSDSLPPRECQAVIRRATALLNSSRSESMPNTILEAMALGTPVLARDVPGNACIVTHCQTGLLYSCPASFIGAFDTLLQDPSFAAALVDAAREQVLSKHSQRQERDDFLRILQKVVKE